MTPAQQSREQVFRYKAKADQLVLAMAFFFVCAVAIGITAASTAPGLYSAFLWLLAAVSLAYSVIPLWCLTRRQNITITPTAIRAPASPSSSVAREIPFSAIWYVRADERTCDFAFTVGASRGAISIQSSFLVNRDAYAEICRVLKEKTANNTPPTTLSDTHDDLGFAPDTPVFEVYVGENKVANLCEPRWVEMFWCSYRVEPTSPAADQVLRDEAIWAEGKFTVKAPDGSIPNPDTFVGGDYVTFCRRETDRMAFRSLWPEPPRRRYRSPIDACRALWAAVRHRPAPRK